MKRITHPSTIVDDLMPGTEYVFRVLAGNQIGSSEPSEESDPFQMPRSPLDTEFSLDPFENHYDLLGEIGRCANYVCVCVTKFLAIALWRLKRERAREREWSLAYCYHFTCSLPTEVAMVQCTSVCTTPLNRRTLQSSSHLMLVVTTPSTS